MPAAGRGGGHHEQRERSVLGGSRDCAVRGPGRAAAGHEEEQEGGTGEEGAASGLVGGSGGGGGKEGGSGRCGRTGHGGDAWGPERPSPPGLCGAGWRGEGCGR